jgi:hypothetical protein
MQIKWNQISFEGSCHYMNKKKLDIKIQGASQNT